MELPVPVIGEVHTLTERRSVEEQVVWRHADRAQRLHRRLQRLSEAAQRRGVNIAEI